MFAKQVSVLRGQCFNLIEILNKEGSTPLDLVSKPNMTIVEEPVDESLDGIMERSLQRVRNQIKKLASRPFFSSC
jgi:hypothetical protein